MPAKLQKQRVPPKVPKATLVNHSGVVARSSGLGLPPKTTGRALMLRKCFENRSLCLIYAGGKVLAVTVAQVPAGRHSLRYSSPYSSNSAMSGQVRPCLRRNFGGFPETSALAIVFWGMPSPLQLRFCSNPVHGS